MNLIEQFQTNSKVGPQVTGVQFCLVKLKQQHLELGSSFVCSFPTLGDLRSGRPPIFV